MGFKEVLKRKLWSPWVAGAMMGVSSAACIALVQINLGSSGGFKHIVSIFLASFNFELADTLYFSYIKPPEVSPQMIQYIGMLLGAIVASIPSGDFKWRLLPDKVWSEQFGTSIWKRWAIVFLGGFLLEFGAALAGGCPAGLGIAGILQLSPAGLVFIIGVFAAGIAMTKLLFGRNYR